ncbi:MAG: rhodanese-like domain-containing protein [bacterium]
MKMIFITLLFTFYAPTLFAQTDIKIISAKELHDKYLGKKDFVLIDNRPQFKYQMGHIKDALNLTYFKDGASENVLNKEILLKTIKDKKVIFYCTGHNRAYHAANDAITKWSIPKEKVIWFKGGMIEWNKERYPFVSKVNGK